MLYFIKICFVGMPEKPWSQIASWCLFIKTSPTNNKIPIIVAGNVYLLVI